MIRYLVRTEPGWEARDENGAPVGVYGGALLFACQHWRVRRVMFGSYSGCEGWLVEPVPQPEDAP